MRLMIAAPEHGRQWGGIGTYVQSVARELGPRHEITLLSGGGSSMEGARTVPLVRGGDSIVATYARFQIALRRQWPALLREHRPDLLVVHHAQMPDLLATPRCPVVVTTHTTVLGQARGVWAAFRSRSPLDASERATLALAPVLLPAEAYYWGRASHALFVSEAVRREVEGVYHPALVSAATVPNGIDLDGLVRGAAATSPHPPGFLLTTGRLLGWKGLAILLRAVRRLRRAPVLLVTGSGDLEKWRGYARSLGLGEDRVRFLGSVPRPELLALLRDARLFAFPSFTESCPYSLIEAMAFGRPIVATGIPAIQAMVEDRVSAHLVPRGDDAALAAGIERLLLDPSGARRLGEAARERARRSFGVDRMVRDTLRFFESVLANTASRPSPADRPAPQSSSRAG